MKNYLQKEADQRAEDVFRNALQETPPSTPPPTTYSPVSFTTPPSRATFRAPTPPKKGRAHRQERPPFVIEKTIALTPSTLHFDVPIGFAYLLDIMGMYYVDLYRREICIKQPPQKQPCGAGIALMLLGHFIDRDPQVSIRDSFWHWYGTVVLANHKDIMEALRTHTNLEELNYQIEGIFFNQASIAKDLEKTSPPLRIQLCRNKDRKASFKDRLKALQESTQSPLIVSITSPIIDGHWIIIDKFNDVNEEVLVRDPFAGRAYHISYNELYSNWPEDEEVKVIYVRTTGSAAVLQ